VVDAVDPASGLNGHLGRAIGVVELLVDFEHLVDEMRLVPVGG
jgi:hypothetical protein